MVHTFSDNAIMAKVRAMYGKRLTARDYDQMVQLKSVGEVAGYLKRETHYGKLLESVNERLIHRGQLELLVEKMPLDQYRRILKYSPNINLFSGYYLARNEVEQLLLALRLLNSGSMNQYITEFPGYLAERLSFDLLAVARVKTYDQLLDVVRNTKYYRILAKHRPSGPGTRVNLPACERDLLTAFFKQALNQIDEQFTGQTGRDLRRIFHHQINMHNCAVIYRMKRFFGADANNISEMLLPIKTNIGLKTLNALLEEDPSTVHEKIRAVLGSGSRKENAPGSLEEFTARMNARIYERMIRFSIKPAVVLASYIGLMSIEVDNVTSIIEGTRYSVSPEEIRRLIV